MSERLVGNTVANLGLNAVSAAVLIVSTPFVLHRLSSSEYGALALLLSFVQLFTLVDLGLGTTLVKLLAPQIQRCMDGESWAEAHTMLGTAVTLLLAVGTVIGACACWQGTWIISSCMSVPPALEQEVLHCFYLASVTFLLQLAAQAYAAVPVAAQRLDVAQSIAVGSDILRIAAMVGAVALGRSLEIVMASTVLAAGVNLATTVIACRRTVPPLSLRPRFSRAQAVSMLSFSRHVLAASFGNRVCHSADKVVIGAFLPIASVGFFSVPQALAMRIWTSLGTIATVVLPSASTLSASGSRQQMHELLWRSSKTLSVVAGLPTIIFLISGRELLSTWIGPAIAAESTLPLQLLAVAFFVSSHARIASAMCQAADRPQLASRYSILCAMTYLLLLFPLVPALGVVGAALAYLAVQCIGVPLLLVATLRLVGGSSRDFMVRCCVPLALPYAATAFALMCLRSLVSSLVSLAAVLIAVSTIYGALTWARTLDDRERQVVGDLLTRVSSAAQRRIAAERGETGWRPATEIHVGATTRELEDPS